VAAKVSGPNLGGWDVAGYWQAFDSAPGEQWKATVRAWHSSPRPLTGQSRAIVNIEWRDAGGNLISYESHTAADAATPLDEKPTFSVTSGPAPVGTAKARFLLAVLQGPGDPVPDVFYDEATFDKVYAINVKSIFHMVHAVVPLMRKARRGVILNIGSTAGIRPRPGLTWYNSSKGAVNLMSKSLAVELGADNIRVNAICPVMGATGLLEQFMGMPDTPENRKKFIATIPMGRLSTPLDIAKAAVFLASDDAEFITGVEFPVDGGRTV